MSASDLSLWLGLIGTALLALIPLRVELLRFSTRELDQVAPKNKKLADLVEAAKGARESIIVAKWTIWDSITVFAGILLLMFSYIIPLAA